MSTYLNRGHYLDTGIYTGARNEPMAASDFGAETGAYFLKSSNTLVENNIESEKKTKKEGKATTSETKKETVNIYSKPIESPKISANNREFGSENAALGSQVSAGPIKYVAYILLILLGIYLVFRLFK